MGKVLGEIVAKIRDQRLLFLIAVIVAVAILAATKTISSQDVIIIFGISAVVVLVDRWLEFLSRHPRMARGSAVSPYMSIALDFEELEEGTLVRLVNGTCAIQNREDPGRIVQRPVLTYPESKGWLCSIPPEVRQGDVLTFTLMDSQGGKWGLTVAAYSLSSRQTIARLP